MVRIRNHSLGPAGLSAGGLNLISKNPTDREGLTIGWTAALADAPLLDRPRRI
jgi:hypothetical protein